MSLIRRHSLSKKQRTTRAARKAAKKAAKARAVQKAPKTAAAVWTGKRSGKLVRAAAIAVVGVVTLKAIRKRKARDAPQDADSYRSTPTPASSQQAGGGANGPSPAGPTATETAKDETRAEAPEPQESATPPHGDKLTS